MPALSIRKDISSLPATLAPDTVYYVRTGFGFEIYVSDNSGTVAYKANVPDNFCQLSDFIDRTTMAGIAAGTYTGSVHVQVQAALDYCKTNRKTLLVNPYTYYFTQGVTYDYGSHSVLAYGATFNFASMTTGTAFTVSTPHSYYPLWDSATYAIQGLNIKGVAYGATIPSGTIGITFGAGISNSGAHASVQNCSVAGFGNGMMWSDHSYIQKIDSCSIHYCNTAVNYAGTLLQDSGERIGFTNCVLFNSATLVHATSGDFTFSNCSFDYFTQEAIISEYGSSVHLDGCHIETQNTPNLQPWLRAKDSHSRICLANTRIVVNEPVSVYIGIADESTDGESDVGSADGGIYLVNSFVSFTPSGQFTQQTVFKGACYISNLTSFDGGRYSASNKRVHVHVDRNNLLQDYSFERLTSLSSEWVVKTGTGYTAPTITTLQAATGTHSMRINPTAGTSALIKKSFMCSPGAKPSASYKIRGTIPSGETFTVKVYYAGASGYDSLISSRTFIQNYTSTSGEFDATAWVTETLRPYSRAPKGTSRYTLEFSCASASGSMDIYIDDVIVEIIDNHPGVVDLNETSINQLSDVDTVSVAPTNGQALVYNTTSGVWAPGTVAASGGGNLTDTQATATITGQWNFVSGGKFGAINISGYDFADKYTLANSGVTFNYASSTDSANLFPYYRDFTIFNGKGLAAFKMTGASRTCTFYNKMQFGLITAGSNNIDYTGPVAGTGGVDVGDTADIALNYSSGFDATTGTYSQPYFRSFSVFNGKGAQLFKVEGNTYSVYVNVSGFKVMDQVQFRGLNTAVNGVTFLRSTHTANRTLDLPDVTGTLITSAQVDTKIATTISGTTVALGTSPSSTQVGKYAYSGGKFSTNGDSQQGVLVIRASTTDATSTVLTSNGSAEGTTNQVILTDNQAMTFNALITARQNTTGDTAAWNISGCIKRGSGVATTTLVGTPFSAFPMADTGAAAWTVVVAADTTNGGLKFTVTGEASKTIRWSATVYTNELAG